MNVKKYIEHRRHHLWSYDRMALYKLDYYLLLLFYPR